MRFIWETVSWSVTHQRAEGGQPLARVVVGQRLLLVVGLAAAAAAAAGHACALQQQQRQHHGGGGGGGGGQHVGGGLLHLGSVGRGARGAEALIKVTKIANYGKKKSVTHLPTFLYFIFSGKKKRLKDAF